MEYPQVGYKILVDISDCRAFQYVPNSVKDVTDLQYAEPRTFLQLQSQHVS